MKQQQTHSNKQQHPINKNPYQVPDGYFSDLRNNIIARVAQQQQTEANVTTKGLWGGMKGLVGFAGTFACLVLFATVGFYFTGYKAQVKEADYNDPFLGYTLYSEDIEDIYLTADYASAEAEKERTLFAEAVTEYLDMFGYGTIEESDVAIDPTLDY